jgi:hypothetical protein
MIGLHQRRWIAALAMAVGPILPVGGLCAQDAADPDNAVIVTTGEGAGHTGRLAVNIAAGNHNQQAASALVAQGDVAVTLGAITQISTSTGSEDTANRIAIGAGAFAGNAGLVSLNITAGTQNQSANLAALTIGPAGALSDLLLEQSRAPIEPSGGTAQSATGPNDVIAIGDDAFGQGSGLFQANVIGGERNSSANTFSLTVTVGGQP